MGVGRRLLVVMVGSIFVWACGSDKDACSGGLASELRSAKAGDTVHIGACRIEAALTVPAGVTLEGEGRGVSTIASPPDSPAIVLTPGTPAARLRNLSIQGSSRVAVVSKGQGDIAVEHVDVTVSRGIAIGIDGATTVTMDDVHLTGPVTAANAQELPPQVTSDITATHGLVLINVSNAQLTELWTSGFAAFGALLENSTTTWTGGGATDNLGTATMVWSGTASFQNLLICRTFQGFRLIPAYGAVFAGGAMVSSRDLQVCDGEGFGMLHSSASAEHADLIADNNSDAAVWIQQASSFVLTGENTELKGNRFAGIVAVDSSNLEVSAARIETTRVTTRVFGETGRVAVGDGIQLVGSTQNIALRNLELRANERVGVLLELEGGTTDGVQLQGVVVDGVGAQLGAIAQGGTANAGWDSGVTRTGATAVNDSMLSRKLDIAGIIKQEGIVGPNSLPSPIDLSTLGIDALIQ